MKFLNELNSYLNNLPSSGIVDVVVSSFEEMNVETTKTYPLVFWNLSSVKGKDDLRKSKITITIDAYVADKHITEEEAITKKVAWDNLRDYFKLYLDKLTTVETSYACRITNANSFNVELYDRGGFSVEEDIAIGYKGIEIEIYC